MIICKRIKIALAMCVLCATAFSQELPTIAVYVFGTKTEDENKTLSVKILTAFENNGRYTAMKNPENLIKELDKEQRKLRNGTINDKQAGKIGKQFGVEAICLAKFTQNQISVRIVNAETSKVVNIGEVEGQLKTTQDLSDMSKILIETMLGESVSLSKGLDDGETIIDSRTGEKHRIKQMENGSVWFMQNLGGKKTFAWNEAKTACPSGWHLPNNTEWNALAYIFTQDIDLMIEFSKRENDNWWSSTETGDGASLWHIFKQSSLEKNYYGNYDYTFPKTESYEVRCVKD